MIRIVSLLRRKPELTHEEFVRHWREVHVPMIERNAEVLGVLRYSIVEAAAVLERLAEDEHRFVDRARSYTLLGVETEIIPA